MEIPREFIAMESNYKSVKNELRRTLENFKELKEIYSAFIEKHELAYELEFAFKNSYISALLIGANDCLTHIEKVVIPTLESELNELTFEAIECFRGELYAVDSMLKDIKKFMEINHFPDLRKE